MWYEFCLITDKSIVQVDHCSGQSVTDKDKMFTKTFTPRKHQAAQYNTTEHFSPVPFQSLACVVCILIPFNQSSFLNLFLSAFTCTILLIGCLNSTENFGPQYPPKSVKSTCPACPLVYSAFYSKGVAHLFPFGFSILIFDFPNP